MGCSSSRPLPEEPPAIGGLGGKLLQPGCPRTGFASVQHASPATDTCATPWNEQARLDALRKLGLLGQPADPRFDGTARLLKSFFQVEFALVRLDTAQGGQSAPLGASGSSNSSSSGTPIRSAEEWPSSSPSIESLCEWMLDLPPAAVFADRSPRPARGVVVIEDLLADPRFQDCPYVKGLPGIRFFAGIPVLEDGQRLACLYILDLRPRHFEQNQYALLTNFAEMVARELREADALAGALAKHTLRQQHDELQPPLCRGGSSIGGDSSDGLITPRCSEAAAAMDAAARCDSDTSELAQLLNHMSTMRPKVFEEVTLGSMVGQGSYGKCYRGLWLGGHVVVKIRDCIVDRTCLLGGPGMGLSTPCQGAVVEALLGRSLAHPHLVQTYEYGVSAPKEIEEGERGMESGKLRQQVWIIQAYCNRGTLLEAIERGDLRGPHRGPNLPAILRTAQEVAGAMECLHQHDVLHGDLTCANIMLTSSNKDARRWLAQVADFGLSRIIHGSAISQAFGTITHMPPELLSDGLLSTKTDVYSYGVVLWEMCAGERAWAGRNIGQIMHSVVSLEEELDPIPDVPVGLQDLVARCLHRDPAQRPSFQEILATVTSLLRELKPPPARRCSTDGPGVWGIAQRQGGTGRCSVDAAGAWATVHRPASSDARAQMPDAVWLDGGSGVEAPTCQGLNRAWLESPV